MNKRSLLYFILGVGVAALAFFIFANNAEAKENGGHWTEWKDTTRCIVSECGTTEGVKGQSRDYVEESCEYSCPVITFKWFEDTFHVTYEKSEDPHKCHRPSDDDLKELGMSRTSVKVFKRIHKEWKDSKLGECGWEVIETESRRVPCEGEMFACGTHRWCEKVCDWYEAIAVPNNEENPEGKPWVEGMDKNCEFPEEEPEPTPEPRDEPENTFHKDSRCLDPKPADITWLEITDGAEVNDWHPHATWAAEGGDTIEVRFSDDPDNLKWNFEMSNDGHEILGFMHNTGLLGMVDYYYQFRTVNGCTDGDWTELTKAFN